MFRKPFWFVICVLVLATFACGAPAQQRGQAGADPVDGKKLFQSYGCSGCHSGGSNQAPPLTGIYGEKVTLENGETVTADEAYLRESILDPQAKVVKGYSPIMPDFSDQINEDQVNALIDYVRSLK